MRPMDYKLADASRKEFSSLKLNVHGSTKYDSFYHIRSGQKAGW